MFYLFKTIFDSHPRERTYLRAMRNKYAPNKAPLQRFLNSDVAKQTYKPIAREGYRIRVDLLFNGENISEKFPTNIMFPHWRKVRKTLAISEDRKIIFVHIPKCGGTSIDRSDIFEGGIHRHGHPSLPRFKEILGPRLSQFRVLTLVRNPWDRLISAFHFASQHAGSYHNRDSKVAIDLLSEFEDDLHRFLATFCDEPNRFTKALWFRPAVSFFDPAQCDVPYFIQKLEEKDNLGPLRQFLGMPDFQLGHERIGTTPPSAKSAFTEEIFRKVGEIYAADVQAFGYQDTTMAQLKY